VVAIIPKNSTERVQVTAGTFKGHRLVGARVWWLDAHGKWHPTKRGIVVRVELVELLVEALVRAEQAAGGSECG
jgi:hypothetical protein